MSTRHVLLAVLMLAVTYPARALPLLAPGIERLPRWALAYLRLIGPAVLAALAATSALVVANAGERDVRVGMTAVAVVVCVVLVARTRNFLLGLAVAVALAALARMTGIAVG